MTVKAGLTQIIVPENCKTFLDIAKNTGYDCVELLLKQKEGYIHPGSTDEEIREVRAYAESLGLDIVSTCIGRGSYNLLDSGEIQEKGIQEAIEGLKVTAKLGAKVMLHTLGSFSPDLYYEDAYSNAVKSLKEIAKGAEEAGCALAVEMVWNGFLFSPLEMRNLIDEVGSEYIGFYFDPGNMAVFQYPQHWVRALGKRTKMVHMKDYKGGPLNGKWTALLDGGVNFQAVMKELKAAGVPPVFISEVDNSLDSFEHTAKKIKEIALFYA